MPLKRDPGRGHEGGNSGALSVSKNTFPDDVPFIIVSFQLFEASIEYKVSCYSSYNISWLQHEINVPLSSAGDDTILKWIHSWPSY